MSKIAKLAIQSNLPQLDRLFDYAIPDHLVEQTKVGSRVRVNFGRSKKPLDAFVAEFASSSDFSGKLSEILEVIGNGIMLQPNILELCRQLADRSAATLGEVLKLAIPAHMPRTSASYAPTKFEPSEHVPIESTFPAQHLITISTLGSRNFSLSEPREVLLSDGQTREFVPSWVGQFVAVSSANLAQGRSTICVVPDYREQEILLQAFSSFGLLDLVANYSQDQPKSKFYSAYLSALEDSPRIVIGSRAAAFAPSHNLGSILVYDESDRSYFDQSAPYLHTRDVVLVRQAIEGCSLLFTAHSISTDIKRLLDNKYIQDASISFAAPRVSNSEPGFRVDSHAYAAIRNGLETGAVLVQVSSVGDSTAMYCQKCDEPARCSDCSGPLWIDGKGNRKCRWCNSFRLQHRCECGSPDFALGRAGASRTASELGKAFPSARVIESTGENRIVSTQPGRVLVVATAGAEPYVSGGYQAVVLLDAKVALSRQNLRAEEDAVRTWSNAIAKGSSKAACVLVGVSGELSQLFCLWNHEKIAESELRSRAELSLPPAIRLGTLTAEQSMISELSAVLEKDTSVALVGPAPVAVSGGTPQWRLIFKYPYSESVRLAKILKVEVGRISAGKSRNASSGRSARAVTVKMNDAEVV
jgi:primosomal protein N' (replication factor Y)